MKKDSLHILEKIEKAEVSPFLLTRIQAKLLEEFSERLSTRKTVIYLTGIALIVVLNVIVLGSKNKPENNPGLVSEMNLVPSNQLYQ